MKIHSIVKGVLIGVSLVGLAACSSTRHHGGAGGMEGNEEGGRGGPYAQGVGMGGGYQPSVACNVPGTPGFNTHSYYFEYDKSDLHQEDTGSLQAIAQAAAGDNSGVRVTGNTDNRGSREYNIALGWRRANAVASALEQYGVNKRQISTESNGAEKPIAFGNDEGDFQCNRRVDVTFRE